MYYNVISIYFQCHHDALSVCQNDLFFILRYFISLYKYKFLKVLFISKNKICLNMFQCSLYAFIFWLLIMSLAHQFFFLIPSGNNQLN